MWFCCPSDFFFLTAISPGSLFGLVTFSHKIGLYDIQGAVPVVKQVIIPGELEARIPVDLESIMPLQSFLAPVSHFLVISLCKIILASLKYIPCVLACHELRLQLFQVKFCLILKFCSAKLTAKYFNS